MRSGLRNFTPLAAQYWASELTTTGAPQRWVTPSASIRRTASRRVRLAQADVTSAGGGHGPGEAPAVAVEHRKRPEVDAALGQLMLDDFADRVDPGAAVGEHHALGKAGGAGGVVDGDAGVLVGDRSAAGQGYGRASQERLVIVDHMGHDRRWRPAARAAGRPAGLWRRSVRGSTPVRRRRDGYSASPEWRRSASGAKWASSAMAPLGASTATRSPAATPSLAAVRPPGGPRERRIRRR